MPKGDCFKANGLAIIDSCFPTFINGIPFPELQLVHGVAVLRIEPYTKYVHCWIELSDSVFDYSNDNFILIQKERYYEPGQINPDNVVRYTRQEFSELIYEHNDWGPWDERFEEYKYRENESGVSE